MPCACGKEFERHRRAAREQRGSLTCDHRKNREVQFINQIMQEQVVPEQTTPKREDVSARLLLECGNLLVYIRPSDDARRILLGR